MISAVADKEVAKEYQQSFSFSACVDVHARACVRVSVFASPVWLVLETSKSQKNDKKNRIVVVWKELYSEAMSQ